MMFDYAKVNVLTGKKDGTNESTNTRRKWSVQLNSLMEFVWMTAVVLTRWKRWWRNLQWNQSRHLMPHLLHFWLDHAVLWLCFCFCYSFFLCLDSILLYVPVKNVGWYLTTTHI
jgi:hypothetical protein